MQHKKTFALLLLLGILLLPAQGVFAKSSKKAKWELQPVGAKNFTKGTAGYGSALAFDKKGNAYAAFSDGMTSDFGATVMRFDGKKWKTVGKAGFSKGGAAYISIAVSPMTNKPYVAFTDPNNGQKLSVMKFDGTSWTYVGGMGSTEVAARAAVFPKIAFDPTSSELYVAFEDVESAGRLAVIKFNGTSWLSVGTAHLTQNQGASPALSFNPVTLAPYVAFQDNSNNGKISVLSFNGTSWYNVGQVGFTSNPASFPDIDFDKNGTAYVVYSLLPAEAGGNGKTEVSKFNGASWELVGQQNISPAFGTYNSIAIDPQTNTPYVAFMNHNNGSGYGILSVRKFDGNQWVKVVSADRQVKGINPIALSFKKGGNSPHILFQDYKAGGKLNLVKLAKKK